MNSSTIRVTAGPMVAGGSALVRRPGQKTMFVQGALPGEVVDVLITDEQKQLVNGRVVGVVEASTQRADPTCELFEQDCGGCQWNYMTPAAQHEHKTDIVRDSLTRIAKIEASEPIFHAAVDPNGYRTTMRMAIQDGRPGMRRRQTHDILSPTPCVITHPLLTPLITDRRYESPEVTMRASVLTGQTTTSEDDPEHSLLTERVVNRDFVVSQQSFFQSGPQAANILTALVDSLVPADVEWIIDAYAGIGILGAVLAGSRNARVTAIEDNPYAVADARQNLADLDVDIIESQVAEVELADLDTPDVVIADPTRTGLGKSASGALAHLNAPLFILVSCDPASMARDIALLAEHEYELDSTHVLDLFPQTPHVETVSVLTHR